MTACETFRDRVDGGIEVGLKPGETPAVPRETGVMPPI